MKNYFILGPTGSGKTGSARKLLYGQKYSVSSFEQIWLCLPTDVPETIYDSETIHIVEKTNLHNGDWNHKDYEIFYCVSVDILLNDPKFFSEICGCKISKTSLLEKNLSKIIEIFSGLKETFKITLVFTKCDLASKDILNQLTEKFKKHKYYFFGANSKFSFEDVTMKGDRALRRFGEWLKDLYCQAERVVKYK